MKNVKTDFYLVHPARRVWLRFPGASLISARMKIARRHVLWSTLALVILIAVVWEWRRIREQWLAIPPVGGQVFSMSPVSTPHYRQRDPRWAEESIGGLGESMGRTGCTVCSLAMALDYYGIKKNPKELNDFLKAHDGYNARGWLRWNSVEKISEGRTTIDVLSRPSHAAMDQALTNRHLVLAKVYINKIIPHWVLVVGKDGNEYLMRDPLMDESTIGRLSDYHSKIFALRVMRQTAKPRS